MAPTVYTISAFTQSDQGFALRIWVMSPFSRYKKRDKKVIFLDNLLCIGDSIAQTLCNENGLLCISYSNSEDHLYFAHARSQVGPFPSHYIHTRSSRNIDKTAKFLGRQYSPKESLFQYETKGIIAVFPRYPPFCCQSIDHQKSYPWDIITRRINVLRDFKDKLLNSQYEYYLLKFW